MRSALYVNNARPSIIYLEVQAGEIYSGHRFLQGGHWPNYRFFNLTSMYSISDFIALTVKSFVFVVSPRLLSITLSSEFKCAFLDFRVSDIFEPFCIGVFIASSSLIF